MRITGALLILSSILSETYGKTQNHTTSTTGMVDFIREAVWGNALEGGVTYGQSSVKRPETAHTVTSVIGGPAREFARKRMKDIEIEPDGRTVNKHGVSNGICYIGACCGWGHRLMRQAKTFTHVHFLQNRTALIEWGPCPNKQGVAGSGSNREKDFSAIMLEDSVDLLNFQTNECNKRLNADCSKCGAGNDISPQKWNEVGRAYGMIADQLGTGRSDQITAGSFFQPFQYFARRLLTQLKPNIKSRIEDFIAENFGDTPVIGVHHRHGNGEIDDFVDRKTGAPSGRLNKNNSKVIDWMVESIEELASEYNIKDYKVFFATDSPEMSRLYKQRDPKRVFIFDQEEKELGEGKGFIMPGWQGWGRSPGVSGEEKHERCEADTIRAFLDMVLLGYVDMLVISKRSTFTFFPSLMMASRAKPVCMFVDGNKQTHFTCQTSDKNERTGLVMRSKADTGLAPSSRRLHISSERGFEE